MSERDVKKDRKGRRRKQFPIEGTRKNAQEMKYNH